MSFEHFISQRYLKVKQKEMFVSLITFLSIAGVAVGVMALIVVIAVMSGAETDIRNRILGIQSHMVLMNYSGAIADIGGLTGTVLQNDNVAAASPMVYSEAMLRSPRKTSGAIIRGIDPQTAENITQLLKDVSRRLARHRGQKETDGRQLPGIVLGKSIAEDMGLEKGDTVYLISSSSKTANRSYLPVRKRFKVLGRFSSGMHEYDSAMAYIHIREAQQILKMGQSASAIAIRLKDIFRARQTAQALNAALGFPYWVRDWMQMNRNLFSALKLQKTVMFIILILIVLVAAFNIAGMLIMMVMEKTKEIAILKAMGATNRSIYKIFIYKGMIIGIVGTILGVSFGWVMCTVLKHYHFIELPADIYYFTTLPVRLDALDVIAIASAAIALCLIATLYPAGQASRLNPIDAIRYR